MPELQNTEPEMRTLAIFLLLLTACQKEDEVEPTPALLDWSRGVPTNILPANGTSVPPGDVTLAWSRVHDAHSYTVNIWRLEGQDTIAHHGRTVPDTATVLNTLIIPDFPSRTYVWEVVARVDPMTYVWPHYGQPSEKTSFSK